MALRLDLAGVGHEFVPRLRRRGDAGGREQLLVVEEGARAGGERDAVLGTLVAAELGEHRHRVRGLAQHLTHLVEQALLRVVGEVIALGDVRVLLVLHHGLHLGVKIVPVYRLHADRDARVGSVEIVGDALPILLAGVGRAVAIIGRDQRQHGVGRLRRCGECQAAGQGGDARKGGHAEGAAHGAVLFAVNGGDLCREL